MPPDTEYSLQELADLAVGEVVIHDQELAPADYRQKPLATQ